VRGYVVVLRCRDPAAPAADAAEVRVKERRARVVIDRSPLSILSIPQNRGGMDYEE